LEQVKNAPHNGCIIDDLVSMRSHTRFFALTLAFVLTPLKCVVQANADIQRQTMCAPTLLELLDQIEK
jgi:hypothetical protein